MGKRYCAAYWLFFAAVLICMMPAVTAAQTTITEGFESMSPTSATTPEISSTLSSGIWKLYKAAQNATKNSGLYGVSLSSNTSDPGYVITPTINTIGTLTFWAKAGGGGKTITVQKSVNGGAFTTLATPTITSTYAQYSVTVNDNSSDIRIKIMNTPASGTTMYIDDVTIVTLSRSAITVSATSLPGFGKIVAGNISSSANYTVSGTVLSSPLLINAPSGFEVSSDNVSYSSSVSLTPSAIDSSVASTTIYVRFAPTSADGTVTGNITHTSGSAIAKNVAVSGIALATEPAAQSAISFGTITGNSIAVNFSGGDGARRLLVARQTGAVNWVPVDGNTISGVNANFSTAQDQQNGNKVAYAGSGTSVTVTGLSVATTYYFAVYEYNGSATSSENYLTASPGTGEQTTLTVPGLTVSPATLSFGNVLVDSISAQKTYSISGVYLTPADGAIDVSVPAGFQVSLTSGSGFTSSLTIPYTGQTLAPTTIYVRFLPVARTQYSGSITNTGGGASITNVAVSGSGVNSDDLAVKAYYVSPTGNDITGTGSADNPFFSVQKAVDFVTPGYIIYMRGGVYNYTSRININNYGTPEKYITLRSVEGERAILDFSGMADADANQGIRLTGSYWHFYGFDVKGAGDNGLLIERNKPAGGKYASIKDSTHQGHHNIIEFCHFYENRDSGIQLKNLAEHNRIINCDSYNNRDSADGDADGFAPKLTVGTGNYFYGCRAWQNSDDGWDLYLKATEDGFPQDMVTVIENCWAFMNGYYKDGVTPSKGNGNGFKLGGSSNKDQRHDAVLKRCLGFENLQKGFDQNGNAGSMILLNCTGFANKYLANSSHFSYRIDITTVPLGTGKKFEHINCVAIWDGITNRNNSAWAPLEMIGGIQTTCNYQTSPADYVSIDTAGVRGPRKADGSLPDVNFMRIKSGNTKLIDKGTVVAGFQIGGIQIEGIQFEGTVPDLGAFETSAPTNVEEIYAAQQVPKEFSLQQNYPNPFNPSTQIRFSVGTRGFTTLKVYDVLGREVALLFSNYAEPGTMHTLNFDASRLPSGTYFSVLQSGSQRLTKKMLFLK